MAKQNNKSNCRGKSRKPKDNREYTGKKYISDDTPVAGMEVPGKSNDPNWYMNNDVLKRQIASIPTGYPTGSPLSLEGWLSSTTSAMPGVMRINYVPTYGYGHNNTDPLNIAARNLYTYINSRNSRNASYEANDLMIYIMCVDSANMFHSFMKRLYGVLNLANVRNRYLPKAIVEACGGNYEDLIHHIKDLQGYINQYAMTIRTLVLPKHFTLIDRHRYLSEGFFVDTDSVKSQLYTFVPSCLYQFSLDGHSAGMAEGKRLGVNDHFTMSFNQIVDFGNELLNTLRYRWGEQDFNTISADILKAFGDENVVSVEYIDGDYLAWALDDTWMHSQIQNLTAFGRLESPRYTQSSDKNYLESTLYTVTDLNSNLQAKVPTAQGTWKLVKEIPGTIEAFDSYTRHLTSDRIVNFYKEDVTPDDVLEATRLMNIPNAKYSDSKTGIVRLDFDSCASEIVESYNMYVLQKASNGGVKLSVSQAHTSWRFIGPNMDPTLENYYAGNDNLTALADVVGRSRYLETQDLAEFWSLTSQFRYHPYHAIFCMRADGMDNATTVYTTDIPFGDTQNFGKVTKDLLSNMNRNILFHMFTLVDR